MNETDLKYFKSFLNAQKSAILNKSLEFKSEHMNARDLVSDEAELASFDLSLNMSIHLHERDRSSLLLIERALGKIELGTFGQCESCGDEIGVLRLKARPFANLCIVCMEEHEDPRHLLN